MQVGQRRANTEVFLVRPGARFVCHADGVCCSDVHVLGPVTENELVPLRRLHNEPARFEPLVDGLGLRTVNGACVFMREDRLCRVHAELGAAAKPATCRRYPFNLVATPMGLRVATPHRCPCRTMGERPLLTDATVAAEIVFPNAPLVPDHRVGNELRLSRGRRCSFDEWCATEAHMLRSIGNGEPPESVLGVVPFARLRTGTWQAFAEQLRARADASLFGATCLWLHHAVQFSKPQDDATLPRPWARFFDAAEMRTPEAESPDAIWADWLADEIWSLQWTLFGSFAQAREDLATRLELGRRIAAQLEAEGTRADRAVAEALLVVDVITHAPPWYEVSRALETP